MQNCCNSTYNSLAPRKIFEHINELWCRTIVSQKCNGNPRTDNNNRQISHVMRKPMFYIRETNAQISFTLTRKLISTFIFTIVIVIFNIVIVPFLYSLNPKFTASKPSCKQCRSRSDDAFYAASVLVLQYLFRYL